MLVRYKHLIMLAKATRFNWIFKKEYAKYIDIIKKLWIDPIIIELIKSISDECYKKILIAFIVYYKYVYLIIFSIFVIKFLIEIIWIIWIILRLFFHRISLYANIDINSNRIKSLVYLKNVVQIAIAINNLIALYSSSL